MKQRHLLVITFFTVTLLVVTSLAKAQTLTVLHTFTGSPDGVYPSPLIRDAEGNLYGTALAGGSGCLPDGCGMVFKIDPAGNLTELYSFAGGNNGSSPLAALARDTAGNLYGTTQGSGFSGLAVVFKLTPEGQETTYVPPPAIGPFDSPVVVDTQGNLYGMEPYGGTPNCDWEFHDLGCGALFMMTPNGEFTIVHNFTGTDGMMPESGLVRDSKGNFYGAAVFGGIRTCRAVGNGRDNSPGCGTIFKVDVNGKFSVLHTFTGKADGSGPLGVIIDSEDNLYGIATGGGNLQGDPGGYGTIFKLDTKTGVFSVVVTRPPDLLGSGAFYASLLARDSKGNLYGAPWFGGAHNAGCLFRVDTKGNYTDLFDFDVHVADKNQDGFFAAGIVLGSEDDVYGSMTMGGFAAFGTVYHITP